MLRILFNLNTFFINYFKSQISDLKKYGVKEFFRKLKNLPYKLILIPVYIICFFIFLFIKLISPFYLIRFGQIPTSRIGHFAANTEVYSCELTVKEKSLLKERKPSSDIVYFDRKICNSQLAKMWKRSKLKIYPRFFFRELHNINNVLFQEKKFDVQQLHSAWGDRDINNLFSIYPSHVSFLNEEIEYGKEQIKKFNIDMNSKIVFLCVRDPAYLSSEFPRGKFDYHNYRDWEIETFKLSAEALTERGYFVFRMGKKVLKKFPSNNPKIIDYANSEYRSDFLDIFLGYICTFCLTTASGIDMVPRIFRKPIAMTHVPLEWTCSQQDFYLLTKHHYSIKEKRNLSISEIFKYGGKNDFRFSSDLYDKNKIELKQNTPEEIRDLALEVADRIEGKWKETEEEKDLQFKFKEVFVEQLEKYKTYDFLRLHANSPMKVYANFSVKFLKNNPDWIK